MFVFVEGWEKDVEKIIKGQQWERQNGRHYAGGVCGKILNLRLSNFT